MKDFIFEMEDFIFKVVLPVIFVPISIFILYLIFIWFPVHLSAEGKCLAKGYPETSTAITLKSYCMNLDGAVTGKVVEL